MLIKEPFLLIEKSTEHILFYGYMASDHSYSERGNPLPPHGLLVPINIKGSYIYAPSHRQDSTYHNLCGALDGTRNSSMVPPHEGSIRRPIATQLQRRTYKPIRHFDFPGLVLFYVPVLNKIRFSTSRADTM